MPQPTPPKPSLSSSSEDINPPATRAQTSSDTDSSTAMDAILPPPVHNEHPSADHQANKIAVGPRAEDRMHQDKEYEALSAQFNNFVVISTFTAALNIAFLSLAYSVIIPQNGSPTTAELIHYDCGQLLGLIATGIQIGIIVVAGRASSLCFRAAANFESPATVEAGCRDKQIISFYRYVQYCERLQLIGSVMLLNFLLLLSYAMFKHQAFFWVLFVASCVGGFSVFNSGFWKVSVSAETANEISGWIHGRFGKSS
ncbi:hypothetical protein H0H81_002507 [Sphagnurus paluster]|uniref:Uncharacterized protein n=1 Tax=Sphagnurus paluster TaxID=117069 RepID=A0A9P7KJV7_9AGAR|nr:hypothetical protein H0H81_002507 [Sphagnurus paluster]